MKRKNLEPRPEDLVARLLQFSEGRVHAHKRLLSDMLTGILGSRSTIVANVARILDEPISLKQTQKRLAFFDHVSIRFQLFSMTYLSQDTEVFLRVYQSTGFSDYRSLRSHVAKMKQVLRQGPRTSISNTRESTFRPQVTNPPQTRYQKKTLERNQA